MMQMQRNLIKQYHIHMKSWEGNNGIHIFTSCKSCFWVVRSRWQLSVLLLLFLPGSQPDQHDSGLCFCVRCMWFLLQLNTQNSTCCLCRPDKLACAASQQNTWNQKERKTAETKCCTQFSNTESKQ